MLGGKCGSECGLLLYNVLFLVMSCTYKSFVDVKMPLPCFLLVHYIYIYIYIYVYIYIYMCVYIYIYIYFFFFFFN